MTVQPCDRRPVVEDRGESWRATALRLYMVFAPLYPRIVLALFRDVLSPEERDQLHRMMAKMLSCPDRPTLTAFWESHGQYIDPWGLDAFQSPAYRRRYRRWVWDQLSLDLQEIERGPLAPAFEEWIRMLIEGFRTYNNGGPPEGDTVVTLAELEAAQQVQWEELLSDPEGTVKSFRVKQALSSPSQLKNLFAVASETEIAADIVGFLWQAATQPNTLSELLSMRSMRRWAGTITGIPVEGIKTPEDGLNFAKRFLNAILSGALMETRGVPKVLASMLRQRYGLTQGKTVLVPWNIDADRIAAESRGYEDVDIRLTRQAIYDSAPPKQREAMELRLEADFRKVPFAQVCRERDLDPNVMRNTLQALKRKVLNDLT